MRKLKRKLSAILSSLIACQIGVSAPSCAMDECESCDEETTNGEDCNEDGEMDFEDYNDEEFDGEDSCEKREKVIGVAGVIGCTWISKKVVLDIPARILRKRANKKKQKELEEYAKGCLEKWGFEDFQNLNEAGHYLISRDEMINRLFGNNKVDIKVIRYDEEGPFEELQQGVLIKNLLKEPHKYKRFDICLDKGKTVPFSFNEFEYNLHELRKLSSIFCYTFPDGVNAFKTMLANKKRSAELGFRSIFGGMVGDILPFVKKILDEVFYENNKKVDVKNYSKRIVEYGQSESKKLLENTYFFYFRKLLEKLPEKPDFAVSEKSKTLIQSVNYSFLDHLDQTFI